MAARRTEQRGGVRLHGEVGTRRGPQDSVQLPPRYIELVNGVYKPTNITSGLSMVHGDDPQKIGLKSDRRDPTQKTSWDEKQPFIWMNATKLAGWWFQA